MKAIKILNNDQLKNMAFNNENNLRCALRALCCELNYKGELLNAYNKSFIFTFEALEKYILGTLKESRTLPNKYAVKLINEYI